MGGERLSAEIAGRHFFLADSMPAFAGRGWAQRVSSNLWAASPMNMTILFGSGLFPNTRANPITGEVFEQAGAVLSSPQMDVLRHVQQQWGAQPK
jgi:hypothetical protein